MIAVYPSGRYWITVNTEKFTLSDGRLIVVPGGFQFDGHSIPLYGLGFLNPYSADMRAALLHDWLYHLHEHGQAITTRRQADWEYLLEMKRCGSNWLRRTVFYTFVRLFGWLWW